MEQNITIEQLSGIKRLSSEYIQFGNEYIYCRFEPPVNEPTVFGFPARINALAVCLMHKGELVGEVDSKPIELKPKSVLLFGGRNVVHINSDSHAKIEAEVLFLSTQFLHDLNFDMSAIDLHSLVESKPEPVMADLSDLELEKLNYVMGLFRLIAKSDPDSPISKNSTRCIAQMLFYQMLEFHDQRNRAQERSSIAASSPQSRQSVYVQEFMQLLQQHHRRHRSISFYADKLFISPKYLSHLIKEATGKSASDLIGDIVIQEAKNMLRYSNKNIQQIAYELNFSTQSSFGKYFKHITGMSPTEFQKK